MRSAEFASAFPHAALLVQPSHGGPCGDSFDTCKAAQPPSGLASLGATPTPSLRWIRKSANAETFLTMVTIGRGATNDIALDAPGVSKFHAFFLSDSTGRITIVDAGSSYGTRVGQVSLRPRTQKLALEGGEQLLLGDVQAVFHTPRSLHAALQGVDR